MWQCSEKPQADNHIVCLMPDMVTDSSQKAIVTPVQPVRIHSTCEHSPKHNGFLANYHIEIEFGRKHGNGACVIAGIDSQIGIFDDVCGVKGISTNFVMCQHVLDCSNQISRHDYFSVCVQGLYGPCKCSRHQIR